MSILVFILGLLVGNHLEFYASGLTSTGDRVVVELSPELQLRFDFVGRDAAIEGHPGSPSQFRTKVTSVIATTLRISIHQNAGTLANGECRSGFRIGHDEQERMTWPVGQEGFSWRE
jgi:hypothetical protein